MNERYARGNLSGQQTTTTTSLSTNASTVKALSTNVARFTFLPRQNATGQLSDARGLDACATRV